MKQKAKRKTTRERREAQKKSDILIHLLISVVALIECLILLTFTTYSWIESSSSLIISSGKDGLGEYVNGKRISLSVAKNLNYQIHVSSDAAGKVKLAVENDDEDQDNAGYYRSVQYFNFAKTSSANGKDFFFRKNDGTGEYRAQDTADFNTSYTYLDFEVRNTTGAVKQFCFSNPAVFNYTGDNSYRNSILNGMRISFEVLGSGRTTIVSPTADSYSAVSSTSHTNPNPYTVSETSSSPISNYVYNPSTANQNPVFTSDPQDSDDFSQRVAIRIWYEEMNSSYAALVNARANASGDEAIAAAQAALDNYNQALANAKIEVNFSLISEDIDYDTLYFDDYAFSNRADKAGSFVTSENSDYGMYLHAFNSHRGTNNEGEWVNMPMTKSGKNSLGADRWIVSVPMPYMVEETVDNVKKEYLTSTSGDYSKWNDTYFYYGDATHVLYKWMFSDLSNPLVTEYQTIEGDRMLQFRDDTSYFRNLGVVRNSSNYNSETVSIEGFLQYDHYGDVKDNMQLIYLRDNATALTSLDYNTSSQSVLNYQYITDQAQQTYQITQSSQSSGTVIPCPDYTDYLDNYTNNYNGQSDAWGHRIFYIDVPAGVRLYFQSVENENANQRTLSNDLTKDGVTYNVPTAIDGACYGIDYTTGCGASHNEEWYKVDCNRSWTYYDNSGAHTKDLSNLPKLNSSDGWVRVYFYYADNQDFGDCRNDSPAWVRTSGGSGAPAKAQMTPLCNAGGYTSGQAIEGNTSTRYKGGVYLNLPNGANPESSSKKTVYMYYDEDMELFKAYVPTSWTDGMAVHYNQLNGYYDVASDKLRWATGASGNSDTYTVLGYSDNNTLAALSPGSGVGTWDDVREIRFTTELMDSQISGTKIYKTGITSATYAMIPVDNLGLAFRAFVPASDLGDQSETKALRFERRNTYNSASVSGIWYPQDDIVTKDITYYAVDAVAANGTDADSETRGWFHVAVFVDATFEKIVYDTLYGNTAVDGAYLSYSENSTSYQSIVTTSVSGSTVTPTQWSTAVRIGDTRWVVPIAANTELVYFKWAPYPDTNTVFDYTINTKNGIYCVVSE